MATLTIRGLDEHTRDRIRESAAENGRSMEAEVRDTLTTKYGRPSLGIGLIKAFEKFREETGGVDLPIPPRTSMPRVPDFGDRA